MLENGYVKLYRSLLKWEWYDDVNTKVVFLHLLLTVSIEDSRWHGTVIRRGSRVSSYAVLAKETRLSVDMVRTAIKHLESTGEVTRYKYPKYTVFAINNFDKFQSVPSNVPGSSQGNPKVVPGSSQQYKKVKKIKNAIMLLLLLLPFPVPQRQRRRQKKRSDRMQIRSAQGVMPENFSESCKPTIGGITVSR